MGIWESLPKEFRSNGEQVLWEGPAAVMTGAVVRGESVPIDTAGVDRGFVLLTTRQLTVGHLSKRRGKPTVWETFDSEDLEVVDHPAGVAFVVRAMGPVDVVICSPSRGLSELRQAAYSATSLSPPSGAKRWHATWGSNGATFTVIDGPRGWVVDGYSYDADIGTDLGMMNAMAAEAAWGQLEIALGLPPSFPPDFVLGDITWEPPLPAAGPNDAIGERLD